MTTTNRRPIVEDDVRADLSRALELTRGEPTMLSEHVYRVLRDAIHEGRLPEHAHISQNPLADALGVSRTPVRDALLRLAQEGLLYAVGGRGYQVAPLEMTAVREIYDVRERIEPWALELARGRITATDLWEARSINQEMRHPDALEPGRYYELNTAFHRTFIRSGRNKTLLVLVDRLWELPASRRMFVQYVRDRRNVEKMIVEHEEIIEAAESGDHDRLIERVMQHVRDAREDTGAFMSRADVSRGEETPG